MVQKQKSQKVNNNTSAAGRLQIQYFTDPLCCWSWAFEEAWQQVQQNYACDVTYYMGGLLANWETYHDQVNAVTRPLQMGPVWMQVRQMANVTINDRIWFSDPPASSYPACVAVKAAARQSPEAEQQYLFMLREAVMVKEANIARKSVLLETARSLSQKNPQLFRYDQFESDLTSADTISAFKADLRETSYRNITRFPTLIIKADHRKGALAITGNRPYHAVAATIDSFING